MRCPTCGCCQRTDRSPTACTHRVDELLAHHDARLDATAAAIARTAGTGYETARALTWTRRQRRLDELDPFNQMLAVMETVAHLDVLALQGRARKERVDGVTGYAPA